MTCTSLAVVCACGALPAPQSSPAPFAEPELVVQPSSGISRETTALHFSFRVRSALPAGAELQIEIPYSMTGENADDMWEGTQTVDPLEGGYVWVDPLPGVELAALAENGWLLGAEVRAGTLRPGNLVQLHYRGQAQAAAIPLRFRARVRTRAGGDWVKFLANDDFHLHGRAAVLARVSTPADVVLGEPFPLRISVEDSFGNPDLSFRGAVSVEIPGVDPITHFFAAEDSGRICLEDQSAARCGLNRPLVSAGELAVRSSPLWVHAEPPRTRRYFGDTHFHTGRGTGYRGWVRPGNWISGGDHRGNFTRQPLAYAYARDVAGLDWASASEHDVTETDDGLLEANWLASQDLADELYEPGRFTTFYAWEWTNWQDGHRLVYYKDRGGAVFHSPIYGTPDALFAELEAQQLPAIVIPHVMQPKADHLIWTYPGHDLQRVGEIYSHHNDDSGEEMPDLFELSGEDAWSFRYAWSLGHQIGVLGSSDDHFGMPGRDGFAADSEGSGGLAVALATANTREAIWEALQARRVYATTGNRLLLDLRVDGQPMGSVIPFSGAPPQIRIAVGGTGPLEWAEIVRGQGGEYRRLQVPTEGREQLSYRVLDETVSGDALYYLRVRQEDGEMGWTSPIWLHGADQ